jgi:hypothetical protein
MDVVVRDWYHRFCVLGLRRVLLKLLRRMSRFFVLFSLAPLLFAQGGGPNYSINFGNLAISFQNITVAKRFPVPLSGSGIVVASFSNVAGSPSGCQLSIVAGGSQVVLNGTGITDVATFNASSQFTPAAGNSLLIERVGSTKGIQTAIAGSAVWQCATYPTSGTVSLEFVPDPPVTTPLWIPFYINTNTCTVVKNGGTQMGGSEVHTLNIGTAGTGETLTIFNGAACTGTVLYKNTSMTVGSYLLDIYSDSGIWIQTSGTTAGDYTVSVR